MASAAFFGKNISAQNISVIETKGIKMHVYSAKPENFEVTSVLLEGKKDAVLIDAQFSNEEAQHVVDMIKKTGKTLTAVFISQADPDFYFGLALIADNFPDTEIISTAQTAYLIDATKDSKLEIWGPGLKEYAPKKFIVPTAVTDNYFMLEDIRIEIRQRTDDPDYSYLWIPSLRTILGGVYLFDNMHLWLADPQFESYTGNWTNTLADMDALNPEYTIPAHFAMDRSNMKGDEAIKFTRRYLADFKKAAAAAKESKELIAAMKSLYPDADGEPLLELAAKVVKGETTWKKVYSYPPISRKAEVQFGNNIVIRHFKDNKHMFLEGKAGELKDVAENVEYTAVQIAPGIYMVYWRETAKGFDVVAVEDYNNGILYTNISATDGTFTHVQGSIKIID